MASDIAALCLRCSQPAGDAHHRLHKRMGGRGDKAPASAHDTDPLCRACHTDHHDGLWDYSVNGLFYSGSKGGDFHSPLKYDDLGEDPRFWTPTKIKDDWHTINTEAIELYEKQCRRAWVLQERVSWMFEWYIAAAAMLSLDAPAPVHWRRVYERCQDWETYELKLGGGQVWKDIALLGPGLRRVIAGADDPKAALDTAMVERLAGMTVAETQRIIKGLPEPEPKLCPHCGGILS